MTDAPPAAPPDLKGRGLEVWTDINGRFTFSAEELALVLQVARTVQRLDDLEEAMSDQPYIVSGSQKQPVTNPLLDTIRSYRALYVTLLRQLDLPEDDDDEPLTAAQRKGRHAAAVRWSGHTTRADAAKARRA